jgi:proline iminopeptidase
VIYLDHRGNGRSDAGPKELWTLAQWGDDVRSFCDALGIERPIVLGVSFGGMVAMAYATRHPGASGQARARQHRGEGRLVSGAARRDVRAPRRARGRRAGASPLHRQQGAAGPGRGRRMAQARDAVLHPQIA